MLKVLCIKDYGYFECGKIYYSEEVKYWSGMTYVIGFNIYDLSKNKISEIGYLYSEVFQPLYKRRENIINKLLNE